MAQSRIKGITVEIGGDATKLGKALESVNKQSKDLASELKGINTLLKLDPTNTTLLAQKQRVLAESIEKTKEKLNTLKSTQEQVQAQFEKGDITEEQYRDFQREIAATEIKLKSLTEEYENFDSANEEVEEAVEDASDAVEDLGEEADDASTKVESLSEKIKNTGERVKETGDKITEAGQKISKFSAAAAAALGFVSKEAIDFESAWAGVTKTVDGTEQELADIKQGILDMSQVTASSAEDIAAVSEAAGQLGIKTEDILDFTHTMVMLGDSTNLSADEAATALAKFANITQMSADDYGKLGSTIVDLGNNYATTEADIVAMATRLASTGEVTGLTESQILALATTLSSVGIEAEAGGTAISKLLKKLYTCNAGFDRAQKAVNSTGMSLRDLQLLQANNSTEFKNLADSLGLTSTELKGYINNVDMMNQYAETAGLSVEEFRKAYGEDAVGALSLFIGGLNETERNGKNAVEILNDMGLTEVRLSNAILAMSSSGDLMNNAINDANAAWGENTALTTEAEKRYATTESKIQQLKGALTEMCVVLGETLLPIIQSLVEGLKSIVNWFTNLDPTIQNIILAVTGFIAVLGPALITVGKIISAVGTIMTWAPKLVPIINLIKGAVSGLFGLIAAHPIVAVITAIVGAVILLWNNCEWFRDAVIGVWEAIKNALAAAWNWIKGVFNTIINFVKENWQALLLMLVNPFVGAFKLVYDNCEVFRNFIDNLWAKIKEVTVRVWNSIKTFFVNLWNSITTGATNAWNGFKNFIVNLWNGVKNVATTVWNAVKNFFSGLWNGITTGATNAWNGFKNFIVNLWNGVANIATNVWNGIANFFTNLWSSITSGATNAWNGFKDFISGIWDGIKNIFSSAWDSMKNIGKNIVEGLWNGISGAASWLWEQITGFGNDIIGWFANILGIHSPSTVTAEFGKFWDQGLAKGILDNMNDPIKAAQKMAAGVLSGADMDGLAIENNLRQRGVQMAAEVTAKSDSTMLGKLDKILTAIEHGKVIAIDGKKFVGETVAQYDNALGQRRVLAARGAL